MAPNKVKNMSYVVRVIDGEGKPIQRISSFADKQWRTASSTAIDIVFASSFTEHLSHGK
jgi:hypothetical protein